MREVPRTARPFQIAVAVANELVLRTSVPRNLFTSLFLGLAALEPSLPRDPRQAVRALEAHLRNWDRTMRAVDTVVEAASDVIRALQPVDGTAPLAVRGLSGARPLAWSVRKRQSAYRWFASAAGANTAIDGLVQLNQWNSAGADENVDSILLRAFLADLRRGFTRWWKSDTLTHNVVLLIDDADWPGATSNRLARLRFVEVILAERLHHLHAECEGDPLMIVAASGTRVEAGVSGYPFGRAVIGPTAPDDMHLGPLQLSAVREAPAPIHVVDLSRNVGPSAEAASAERLCRSIAAGNPWALERLRVAAEAVRAPRVLHVESLLSAGFATEATAIILQAQQAELGHDLRVWSAVAPQDPLPSAAFAGVLATVPGRGVGRADATMRRVRVEQFVARKLWEKPGSGALHPFFRRVLLCELSGDAPALSWDSVFASLATVHDEDSVWHYYYLLSGEGTVLPVTRYLARRLHRADAARRWLDDLDRMTAAPRKRDLDPDLGFGQRLATALRGVYADDQDPDPGLDRGERLIAEVVAA